MLKSHFKLIVFVFLVVLHSTIHVFASVKTPNSILYSLATLPPTVTTPIYLCQNSTAVPLTATSSGGGTLNWYLTNLPTESSSAVAPIPNTTAVGATTYYVTETIAGVESSPRTPIVVNIVANSGATISSFSCDPSQILAADRFTSVFFDWGNNALTPGSLTYNYTYTISGGATVTGQRTNGTTHLQVFGLTPGQSVTMTITSITQYPCVPPQTIICSVPCITTTTPTFNTIAPFCSGATVPLLPLVSNEGISGTWNPSLINNSASGAYTFTPNNALFPCALPRTINTTVSSFITPTFAVRPAICHSEPITPLPTTSTNGITGIWSPALDNTTSTTYLFTPTIGQCATSTNLTISVNPIVVSNFAQIPPICSGSSVPVLATTSPNGITGSWLPSTISNTVGGTYVFTPNAGQCANSQSLDVIVRPSITTNFDLIPAFCSGTIAPYLANISPNGVTGTWNPIAINNRISGSYVFTPNATECATSQTLNVEVTPLVIPDFADLTLCSGSIPAVLDFVSPNGITGTWSPAVIDNTANGTYVFTPDSPQCASSKSMNVTVNPSNTLVGFTWTVTDAFSKNQIITVTPSNSGNYLYQLDSGPFQTSSVFENVASGLHSITVIEKNGCSTPIVENNILVINYPKFFTPNGDSFNDKWNIFSLKDHLDTRIYIFDRFGKLLKDISPLESGWDGTYIGQPMPADDYWFTVKYAEQNNIKEFKAHFSLKR